MLNTRTSTSTSARHMWRDPAQDHPGYSSDDSDDSLASHTSTNNTSCNSEESCGEEVYGDFQVVPRRRQRLVIRPKTHPFSHSPIKSGAMARTVSTVQSSLPTASWSKYMPPEIVSIICSYSTQSTLCQGISLVCRQWYRVAKPYIEYAEKWTLGPLSLEDELVDKMRKGYVHALEIIYYHETPVKRLDAIVGRMAPFDTWKGALERFANIITTPDNSSDERGLAVANSPDNDSVNIPADKDKNQDTMVTLASKLRKVIFRSNTLHSEIFVDSLLPHLHNLRTLTLKAQGYYSMNYVPLTMILNNCKHLTTLSVIGESSQYQRLCRRTLYESASSADNNEEPQMRHTFRLEHFYATKVAVQLPTFTWLIDSCPGLISFEATEIWPNPSLDTQRVQANPAQADAEIETLYEMAANHCPDLERFQVVPGRTYSRGNFYYPYDPNERVNRAHRILNHFTFTRRYFPATRKIDLYSAPPLLWSPSQEECLFLSRLTHIDFYLSESYYGFTEDAQEACQMVLRCARSLTHFKCQDLIRFKPILFSKTVPHETLKLVKDIQQKHFARTRHDISDAKLDKIERRVYKKVAREERKVKSLGNMTCLPHPDRWLCRDLKVVDLAVDQDRTPGRHAESSADEFMTMLALSCPHIVDLTLRLTRLYIGQWKHRVCLDSEEYPERTPNNLLVLGGYHGSRGGARPRLVRLRRLSIILYEVPGTLCVGDFSFMRLSDSWDNVTEEVEDEENKHGGERGGTMQNNNSVYWPQLEYFSIHSKARLCLATGTRAVGTFDETVKGLTRKLEAMRPGVHFDLK